MRTRPSSCDRKACALRAAVSAGIVLPKFQPNCVRPAWGRPVLGRRASACKSVVQFRMSFPAPNAGEKHPADRDNSAALRAWRIALLSWSLPLKNKLFCPDIADTLRGCDRPLPKCLPFPDKMCRPRVLLLRLVGHSNGRAILSGWTWLHERVRGRVCPSVCSLLCGPGNGSQD